MARNATPPIAAPSMPPMPKADEIMGLDHQLMTPDLADRILPEGVPIARKTLQRAGFLLTHPAEFDQTPPAQSRAIVAEFDAALDRALRDRQKKNVEEFGHARPFEAACQPPASEPNKEPS
jgi:hypothetical protein